VNLPSLKKLLSEQFENLCVEYELRLPDHIEFAKDVAAMANAAGGLCFIGVEEEKNGEPIIRGVDQDKEHNKELIINVLSDRIQPKISGLEVETVPTGEDKKVVFVIRIPAAPYMHGVRGETRNWLYFIRRPGRVEELDPNELIKLCKVKNSYIDNKRCRTTLLEIARVIEKRFADYLEVPAEELGRYLTDEAMFRRAVLNSKMRNLTFNLLGSF
jgi:predicted HTH transcriptional regulator